MSHSTPTLDIENLAHDERLDRIIELLAIASIRLVEEQKILITRLPPSVISELINRSNEGSQ